MLTDVFKKSTGIIKYSANGGISWNTTTPIYSADVGSKPNSWTQYNVDLSSLSSVCMCLINCAFVSDSGQSTASIIMYDENGIQIGSVGSGWTGGQSSWTMDILPGYNLKKVSIYFAKGYNDGHWNGPLNIYGPYTIVV